MRATLALIALLHAGAALAAGEPAAVATASKTRVSVGETFLVEVRATGPSGTTFAFPAGASADSFELRTAPAGPRPLPPGMARYEARVFALGAARVPPIPVECRRPDGKSSVVTTAAIPLEIVSLLPRDKGEQKLADVRAPVPVPIGRAFWIALITLLVLLGALVWWIVTRRRAAQPLPAAPIPRVEADEEARRSLEALVASGRLARGEYRSFYIELTGIAKRYLERRLGAPIVEMTTAEMLALLRSHPHGVDLAPTMRDLAGAADQIKFARGLGLTEEAERHLAATRATIVTLETRMRPVASPDGRAA